MEEPERTQINEFDQKLSRFESLITRLISLMSENREKTEPTALPVQTIG